MCKDKIELKIKNNLQTHMENLLLLLNILLTTLIFVPFEYIPAPLLYEFEVNIKSTFTLFANLLLLLSNPTLIKTNPSISDYNIYYCLNYNSNT